MTLIFRAIWNDPDHVSTAMLSDEFVDWAVSKGFDRDDIPRRGRLGGRSKELDIRRGDSEAGEVYRGTLIETAGDRVWTTTATALYAQQRSTYWVDVQCGHSEGDRPPIAAPRLVRNLLMADGSAHSGPTPLSASHHTVLGGDIEAEFDLLLSRERSLPIVIFSPDERVGIKQNDTRARAAAEILAGIAAVYLLSPAASTQLERRLPDGFRVYGGAARLYMPDLDLESPDDARRHRWFPVAAFNRAPRRAGQLIAGYLAQARLWPDPPEAWADLRRLIMRPTDGELAELVGALGERRPTDSASLAGLQREVHELRELLVLADAERASLVREHDEERARLRSANEQLQNEHVDDAAELEERDLVVANLLANLRAVHATVFDEETSGLSPDRPDPEPGELMPSDVLGFAAAHLPHIAVHPDAEQAIDELDGALKAQTWAYGTWHALAALNDYAAQAVDRNFEGNFKTWCNETGRYSARKVAISESETVKSGQLAERRRLPVSTEVDRSGRILMLWHLKIQEGGGPNIPRLYFHDDSRGVTAKIHIGFYGPHRLMPNTRTN